MSISQETSNVNTEVRCKVLTADQRDIILGLAGSTYLITANPVIKSDMLDIIRPLLSEDFTRHFTDRGVMIERVDGEVQIRPFVTTLVAGCGVWDKLVCPNCGKGLNKWQILSQRTEQEEIRTVIVCECRYFSTILDGRGDGNV